MKSGGILVIIGKVNAYLHNKNISMKGNKSQTNKITSEQSKQNINKYRRTLLCIPDGWGINQSHPEYDATELSNPVNLHRLEKEGYFIKIHTDGEYVGLPAGQMGNSEV